MNRSRSRVSVPRFAIALACFVGCRNEPRIATAAVTRWSPDQLLGCYVILDGKQRPADSAWYNAMSNVRLTDAPMHRVGNTVLPHTWHLRPLSDAGLGHWKAEPPGEQEDSGVFVPTWSLTPSGDSAAFDFGDGFSGAIIKFAAIDASGDTLRGRVTEHWDFGPPFSHDKGAAYAVRRPCS